jgi:hypothetical protein
MYVSLRILTCSAESSINLPHKEEKDYRSNCEFACVSIENSIVSIEVALLQITSTQTLTHIHTRVRTSTHNSIKQFLTIKLNRCANFLNLFWNKILHISDNSSVCHQKFFTVHTAMVYVIQVCWQLVSRSICSCSQAVSKTVWHIILLCVQ